MILTFLTIIEMLCNNLKIVPYSKVSKKKKKNIICFSQIRRVFGDLEGSHLLLVKGCVLSTGY